MGDVAMTVPVLRALTKQYPELKVTLLTRAFFAPFFRDIENVNVFSADLKGKHKGVFGLYKLARELNKSQFYVIADLHNVLRTKVLKQFLRCKRFISIDKGRKKKKQLTSGKIFEPLKTTHQRYADVFKGLGYPIDLSNPSFPERVELGSKLQKLLDGSCKTMIGIAPFAAHEGKMYPLELTKKVIEALSKDYKILLFGGGKKEIDILNEMEFAFENTVIIAGKLTLDEELDVVSNLGVMLSMDSGNAHIAAMLGIKTVIIWGVTHPYAGFAPFNQPDDYALLANRNQFPKIPTSVYGNKYPENYEAAAGSISPEVVVEKIKSII
ncbi:glycosyltransferase family 9 protein [Tamlana crocina]|uniref:Glycosyltransferase family 9 protein n=2 Tax=Tamlana crocina TaxID=393006 RepID=A0ABX1DCP4_9FLAO|nr:glycosyltransferase family 9 protein [Tamlana crocina]